MDTPLLALTRPPRQATPERPPRAAEIENMRQLMQLRWLAAAGQLVAIVITHWGLGVVLPVAPMLGVVAALAIANLLFSATLRRGWVVAGELLLALLIDMVALTVQLYLSGGADNPFVALYLLQVALGAILLRPQATWLLVAAASAAVIFLSLRRLPLRFPADLWVHPAALLRAGEWISFAMVAALLVLFITRISRNLRARDAYVAELGQRAAEEDGIVRMGLFASGAAHELGTPLSSLSVLLADWQRHPAIQADAQLREEIGEAQDELGRCKDIVSDILHSAGQSRGEAMQQQPIKNLLSEIADDWRGVAGAAPIVLADQELADAKVLSEPALRQAIWSLLENAADASPSGIVLRASVSGEQVAIAVEDQGPGFDEAQMANAGRLYPSSKHPGHGIGLFLASNVARRLGGTLHAENRPEGGARVQLLLPLARAQPAQEEA